jgi:HSP20 family protein
MLLRWTTWNEPSSLDRIESWLAHRNQTLNAVPSNGHSEAPTLWQPPVDVREDAERITLVADLPGLEQSDVELSIDKNILTLRGERRRDADKASGHHERAHGHFSRAFTLPPTVDLGHVSADMRAGVLTVTLPKKPEAKPRPIKINVTPA